MNKSTVKYFEKTEWGVNGNQCPECNGIKPTTEAEVAAIRLSRCGHIRGCLIAESIEESCEMKAIYVGDLIDVQASGVREWLMYGDFINKLERPPLKLFDDLYEKD